MAASTGFATPRPTVGRSRSPGAIRNLRDHGALVGLLLLLVVMFLPFLIITTNAIKSPQEYAANGPLSLPSGIYLNGIFDFWNRVDFTSMLINSTVISLSVAILSMVLSLLNGFAMGIGRMRGSVWLLVFFMIANMLPNEGIAYPLYYFAKFVHLYDTQLSVIIIFTVIQSAFGTYLITSVLRQFPREILDAARVDGCSKLQLLVRIVAPISKPSLSVFFAFSFIWTWNEFFLPLIMLVSNSKQTVPIAISVLQGQNFMDPTTTASSALLGVLPCILFFLLFQRSLTRGVLAGSAK
ncbi:MAG TPA: carbohydrate ABC transporter permease [Terriglobales bacterium]|jgi:raffinose/stachyose/melibiose transport system permease protein|nr:carbohydrate ABC transporter permease [Terriglobales bacterium]